MLNFDSESVVQRVSAISAAFYTPVGVVLNLLLLALIVCCENEEIKNYKVVLVHTSIMDIGVIFINACLQYSQFFEKGYASGLLNTSLRSLFSRKASAVICAIFYTSSYYAQFATTINFVYRYLGVVWNRQLSTKEYIGMLALMLSILAAFFSWNYFLSLPTDENELVMTNEYIAIFGGPNATDNRGLRTCTRGDLSLPRSKLWEYSFFALMNLMYGLLFYCSLRIFYHVHSNLMEGGNMKRIQKKINIVLSLQTIQPLVGFINTYTCYIVTIFRLDTEKIAWMVNLYTSIFFASASVINPVVAIFGIAKYRRYIFALVTCQSLQEPQNSGISLQTLSHHNQQHPVPPV